MLPCQNDCSRYQNGCHKTCAQWRAYQEEQNAQRQAKTQYLRFHNLRCAQMLRQYLKMQTRRPVWR
jgi:hypothetical protein